jgi:hypothetical protein
VCNAEDVFGLLKFYDLKLTLDEFAEIRKHLEECEEPRPDPAERTMTVSKLTEWPGPIKLASRYLRTSIRMSSEQQLLDKEL